MDKRPCILFTAFEPSGDEHAAPVIRRLRAMRPDVPIYALGGPRMAEAGATLIESTVENAAMLGGAIAKVREQAGIRKRLKQWLADRPVAVHVPTDSPAANWGICKMTKAAGARVVHLVAPQVWAWASWRVKRLHKWSDLVLCLLPFEPAWFAERGVEARFIGHPLFDEPLDEAKLDAEAAKLPQGRPRIALLPGSRPGEITKNARLLLQALPDMIGDKRFTDARAVIAVSSARSIARFEDAVDIGSIDELKPHVTHMEDRLDAVLHWADVVLTVSGTVTLHVARHGKPMAIVYRVSPVSWHLIGRWLVGTRTFTLPNLIANGGPHRDRSRHVVREFVPWLSHRAGPIADEVVSLIEDESRRGKQIEALRNICAQFAGHDAGREAAEAIVEVMERR